MFIHFYQPIASNAHWKTGTEKYPVKRVNGGSEHENFSQAFNEIVSCFTHLTKDNTVPPYITQKNV